MKYKKSDKDFFINPYNFVSVNLEETKHFNMEEMSQGEPVQETTELQTGYLVCRMKCRTPLAIPDTMNKKETDCEGHFKYHFMGMKEETLQGTGEGEVKTEVTGTPLIPGSSIRGVIRNVYETITDSCFGTMREDTSITIRSNTPFEPGLLILERKTWKLYAATRHKIVSDAKYYNQYKMAEKGIERFDLRQWKDKSGMQVWFQTTVYQQKEDKKKECVKFFRTVEGEGLKTGYLCIGEQNPNRHFHGIFTKEEKSIKEVTDKELKRLEDTLYIYQNSKINRMYPDKHSGYENYWHMKSNGVIPVYYKAESENRDEGISEDSLDLSFASLGRKSFEKTLNDKVGQKSHQVCNDRNNLCAACSLFGTIEGKGIGSKIRFTDAKCENLDRKNLVTDVIFEELSSPRISYVPFYLFSDNEDANYERGYDSDELQVRGRKFYWHHKPDMKYGKKRTKRNGTYDVIKDTEFTFKIYFDQITKKQLKLLATAIHLNDNKITGKRCHKIGHGKPLGYGSVKMIVEECRIRQYDIHSGWSEKLDSKLLREISFSEMFSYDEKSCSFNFNEKDRINVCGKKTWDELMKISNYYEIKDDRKVKVEYPRIVYEGDNKEVKNKNDLAPHQWFSSNYKMGTVRPEQPFPLISEKKQTLNKYVGERTYEAKLYSERKREKIYSLEGTELDVWTYDISILDEESLKNKEGKMYTEENLKIKKGDKVEVEWDKDKEIFLFYREIKRY